MLLQKSQQKSPLSLGLRTSSATCTLLKPPSMIGKPRKHLVVRSDSSSGEIPSKPSEETSNPSTPEGGKTPGKTPEVVQPTEAKEPPSSSPQQENEDFFASDELVKELKTDFGKRGEVFFFAQAAAMVLIVFCPFQLQGLLDLFATLMLTTGLVFIAYGLLSLGRNLSPMPQPRQKHTLVTTGMYSYVRHPMYAGLLLTAFGLAAVTRNETRLALALGLWFILEKKTAKEEDFLCQRYPEEYEQYKSQVKKFVPFLY
ncbi:hypothetical protein DUNSADRAFT_14735 [Dunaliella salina]|uniref:Protein-S-isoprenylcysteine O-methyltransferase n=1 Tax=Dunaliella salina TaxID=3046 RepID=A0ABQ7H2E5_DUNSA|nr:hypothetical protein DUNSADRAFT_14735 [Dunaliella salina]|eukprot:KAF5841028.1 hypothetical protein DUNSADRAFT_14735 [Dunaliella salina]